MVRIKAFTTIEALFSSLLIMISFGVVVVLFDNLISSSQNISAFNSESRMLELINESTTKSTNIEIEVKQHPIYPDINIITYTGYNNLGIEHARLTMHKKKFNEN